MSKIFLLGLLVAVFAVRPPSPYCQTLPIPSQIPVTIGQEIQFDLQGFFNGYNMFFRAQNQSHITVNDKYTVNQNLYNDTYNFVSAKIKSSGKFIGLTVSGETSSIAIGADDPEKGVQIQQYIKVEDIPNLRCYDVDEVYIRQTPIGIVDCGIFIEGALKYNELIYVNLTSGKIDQGSHFSDVFVRYHALTKRKIEIIQFPVPYMVRFTYMDGVDQQHAGRTYVELFLMTNPLKPQIFDVLDHTFFHLDSLSITDHQIHGIDIYIQVYNIGIYKITIHTDQDVDVTAFVPVQLDATKFRVNQNGFNDDLSLVVANSHTIYQFDWESGYPATLVNKYTLIPGSTIKQLRLGPTFVIAVIDSTIDDKLSRRTLIFTSKTNSYLNAYNSFQSELESPHLIIWDSFINTLQIFDLHRSLNIRLSLPYLLVKPVDESMAGKFETINVTAISIGDNKTNQTCQASFTFYYIYSSDRNITQTKFWPFKEIVADSPDEYEISLSYEYFGPNITYQVQFDVKNSTTAPHYYIDKQHKSIISWPKQIAAQNISYFEMFTQTSYEERKPNSIYGLVQVAQRSDFQTDYLTHYVHCKINVFGRDEVVHMDCSIVSSSRFSLGKIVHASQMFEASQRRIAIIFDSDKHTIYIYYFWPFGFGFYGKKHYAGDAQNQVTGVQIKDSKLFVVLQFGKRIDVYALDDLQETAQIEVNPEPRLVINSQNVRFFNIKYFAPVAIKATRYHPEVIFLKTKIGILGIVVNNQFLFQVLFHIETVNIRYDFQVNKNRLVVISQESSRFYDMVTPLRLGRPPALRYTSTHHFSIGIYDQVASDALFYLVQPRSVYVINPYRLSTSAFYSSVSVDSNIINIDAVNIRDRQVLFVHTKTGIEAWVFAQMPKLYVSWADKTKDFKMKLIAKNPEMVADSYSLTFTILDLNQTEIKPTQKFNKTEVRDLGHVTVPRHIKNYSKDIPINDSDWFEGNVLQFSINCSSCGNNIKLDNHVQNTGDIVAARAIYDIQSTLEGIYAQQYDSLFKTYTQNDSIHYINQIPVTRRGEVCSKLAVGSINQYVVSLCQVGGHVNFYVTSVVSNKPFTFGPYQSEAKAVNYASISGDILMLVDNDDDPFARSGKIFLYHLNFDFSNPDFFTFLDVITDKELQINGFTGNARIGSADIHRPFYQSEHEYRLFITDSNSGSIFVFGFQISKDGRQAVYLSMQYLSLDKLIPKAVQAPTRLKVVNIKIHYHQEDENKNVKYHLILSVANWHHMQLMVTLSEKDEVVNSKLQRLFQRFPWKLGNNMQYKKGRTEQSYFAVPYIDYQTKKQLVLVYDIPYIIRKDALTYEERYSAHKYKMLPGPVPLLTVFGAHQVNDTFEVTYAFHHFARDVLLFTDMDGYNITELTLNRNLVLQVRDLDHPQELIKVTGYNPYTNITFEIDIDFSREPQELAEELLWILIVVVAALMIIGLLMAYYRQKKRLAKMQVQEENRQTLLTTDELAESNQEVDRGSVEPVPVREVPNESMQKEPNQVKQVPSEQKQPERPQEAPKEEKVEVAQ